MQDATATPGGDGIDIIPGSAEKKKPVDTGGPMFPRNGHRVVPDGKSYRVTIDSQEGGSVLVWLTGMALSGIATDAGASASDCADYAVDAAKRAIARLREEGAL